MRVLCGCGGSRFRGNSLHVAIAARAAPRAAAPPTILATSTLRASGATATAAEATTISTTVVATYNAVACGAASLASACCARLAVVPARGYLWWGGAHAAREPQQGMQEAAATASTPHGGCGVFDC